MEPDLYKLLCNIGWGIIWGILGLLVFIFVMAGGGDRKND
jgi:hypothetical protein